MGRTATAQGGGGGFKPEFGVHRAVCCQLVDFGTSDKEWQGKIIGNVNKVNIGFEFVDEKIDGEKGQYSPVWGAQFTNSIGKKANLRGLLEGWRGKPFTDEELKGFDLSKLLGLPCMLVIQPNSKGNPKIQAITKAKENFSGERDLHEFWVEEGCFDNPMPEWMPEWMADEIKKSYEFREGFDFENKQTDVLPTEHQDDEIDDEFNDDDIPF